jgi:hypothetical protein
LNTDRNVTAAILLMTALFTILAERAFLPIGHHREAIRVDAQFDQILLHGLGALLAEDEVVRQRTPFVAMPFDGHCSTRIGLDPFGIEHQCLLAFVVDLPTIESKEDILEASDRLALRGDGPESSVDNEGIGVAGSDIIPGSGIIAESDIFGSRIGDG